MTITFARPDRLLAPVADATRREFLVLVGAAGLLAACGGGDGGGADAGGNGSGVVTVTNQFGTFEVPRQPQRVVGWEGRRDLETALAVGLSPVAIGSNAFFGEDQLAPFIDFDARGVEVIDQTAPNLELIASLRPDLILTRDSNIEELLDELRPLAPLVPVTPDGPWRSDLERVAADLDRRGQLDGVLATYDERRSEVRARHEQRIGSAVLAVVQYFADDGFYASPTTGFYLQANTLADLGGTQLAFLEEGGEAFTNEGFSAEQTGRLAEADAIILIANEAADRADLEASPLWQRLPAVIAGRVVPTDFRTNYGSVFAAIACLDLLDQTYATLA